MKATVTIEISEGESLAEALHQLTGTADTPCDCVTDATETAPAEEATEAPAKKPESKQKRKAATAKEPAKASAPEKTDGAPTAEEAPSAEVTDGPTREDVRKAAMAKMNEGKRDGVEGILKEHGGALKSVPEAELADTLAAIEAL